MGISPVVDLNGADGGTGATLAYTENDAAAAIAPAATVTDADSPDLDSGTLTVSFSAGGSADDRLTILHTGNGAGEIGVAGNAVRFAGTQIGTFAGGISGGTPLVITLDADATPAAVEALTRAIAYSNLSNAPATAARTVDFVLTDGDGDTSVVASATVNVAPVNDAPLFSSPASAISRVNTTDAGVEATGQDSAFAAISPDGTKILFYSNAADLVAGDTNARIDLFLRDLTTGAITRVSTSSSGAEATGGSNAFPLGSFSPVFSPDGTRIAFSSILETLVDGDTNLREDVFVKDLATGAIVRANTTSAGAQGTANAGGSGEVAFSPDGTKVMFISQEGGLVAGDTNAAYDVFIKDLTNGAITRVSTDGAGAQIGGLSQAPVFSPDGTKILFSTAVNGVVPGDTNGVGDIVLKDLVTGAVALISSGSFGGLANGSSVFGAFSPDGTKVVFTSGASNLVGGDTNGVNDIFLKDIATGAITRVSTDSAGGQANGASGGASISPDGSKVLFFSAASNFVSGDTNATSDYFMKDLVTGAVTRVSTDASGAQANASAAAASFSRDGTKIVFHSGASNLVPGDTNGRVDVFVATLGSIGTTGYTENGAAVQVAPVVNAGDDGSNFSGGTLTVAITAGGVAGDALSLATPTGLGLTFTGASVRVAGIVVGTLSASATSLAFSLNANATDAAVRVIAEAVRFASSSDNPGASRTVTFTLVDGGGGSDTSSFTRTISVTPTNDAPTEVSAALTVTKGALVGITAAQLEFDDPDQVAADTAVTYTVTSVTSHGLLLFDGTPLDVGDSFTQDDVNTGRLSYDHDGSGAASDSFQFSVADGDGEVSTGRSFTITVSDPPTAVISGPLLAHEGDRLDIQIDAEWFTVHPRVVAFDDGSFIVIGEVPELANPFASDIFGWRYDADGVAQGSAFRINQHTWLYQTIPDAAVLADGSFIVSWLSTNQGSPGNSVSARLYAADGTALGDEFQVNGAAVLDLSPAIVVTELENGGFVIVWADFGIKGRVFDSAGQALDGEFDIAAGAFPGVASLAGGGFAVAWQADPDLGIYVRQFDASGIAVTASTRLGTEANSYLDPVSVAGLADGSYVVAWLKYHPPTDATAVFAQHFAANGTAMGGEFMAHNASFYEHREPVALALADGGYFIGWSGSDGFGGGVFGQRFTAGDVKVGGEGRIDNLESGAETDPVLAALADGGMIAAWAYQVGNLHHAQVQRYDATFAAVVEQATLDLKGGSLGIGDLDAAGTVTVTLAVDYGVLDVEAGTSGALVSGNDSGSVTLTGTVAQINALLQTNATSVVTYSPNTDAPPAAAELTLAVEYGGDSDVASQTIAITAVNDAPAGGDETVVLNEDDVHPFSASDFNFGDTDGGSLTEVVITTLPTDGTLYLDGTPITVAGTAVSAADIDAGLLTFGPDANENGTGYASLTFQVRDDGGTDNGGQDTDQTPRTITFNVLALNDLPSVAVQDAAVDGTEDTDLVFDAASSNAITVADADGVLAVTVGVLNGTLTLSQTTGLSFLTGDGAGDETMTFSGSVADINDALEGLTYRGELNYEGSDTLSVLVDDGEAPVLSEDIAITLADDGTIDGDAGDNNPLAGTALGDLFDLGQGGDDMATGLDGNDGFYMGAALSPLDNLDGGAGSDDQLGLQGNYGSLPKPFVLAATHLVNIETIVLLSGADTRFGDTSNSIYDYYLKTVDENVGTLQKLTVNFNGLGADEDVFFDGSAESDGWFFTYGGRGVDTIIGGSQSDGFYFGNNGRWGSGDSVTGGGGADDQLGLQGSYTVTFGATQMSGIETLVLMSGGDTRFGNPAGVGYSYDVTMNDGNVAGLATLTVNANTLRADVPGVTDEVLVFNGSAELDGHFSVMGGRAGDTISGGALSDLIWGGLGGDTLTGNGGADTFRYTNVAQSRIGGFDTLVDFDDALDKIDLPTAIASFATATTGALSFGSMAATLEGSHGSLALGQAVVFTADGGDMDDRIFLLLNTNGTAGFQAASDFVIELVNPSAIDNLGMFI